MFWEEFFTHTDIFREVVELFMERMIATNPAEALSSEAIVSDTLGPKVSSVEATLAVPMMSRSPTPNHSMVKEKNLQQRKSRKRRCRYTLPQGRIL